MQQQKRRSGHRQERAEDIEYPGSAPTRFGQLRVIDAVRDRGLAAGMLWGERHGSSAAKHSVRRAADERGFAVRHRRASVVQLENIVRFAECQTAELRSAILRRDRAVCVDHGRGCHRCAASVGRFVKGEGIRAVELGNGRFVYALKQLFDCKPADVAVRPVADGKEHMVRVVLHTCCVDP